MKIIRKLDEKVTNMEEKVVGKDEVKLSEELMNYYVNKTDTNQEIIIDCGSQSTLAGEGVVEKYLE